MTLGDVESPSSRQGTRAPFSFHCTICYDSFTLTDRAPVVLPCGHTYLCEPCSKRLDKCMECRTPLYMKVKKNPDSLNAAGQYSKYGYAPLRPSDERPDGTVPHSRPPQYEKVRLPIPKNHVLMCLLEAVEKSDVVENNGYESGDDDELVFRGMKVLGSSSGTYVVRERKGLEVYPSRPTKDKKMPKGAKRKTLKYGQTVQIVLYENKIATVARSGGYILVDNTSQLVKVGEVTDEACKLEATTKVLDTEIRQLEKKTSRLRRVLESINKRLKGLVATRKDEDVFGPVPEDPPVDKAPGTPDAVPAEVEVKNEPPTLDLSQHESPRPILKRPPPPIRYTQSCDEQTSSFLHCIPALEPSRSFENFASFLRGERREVRESENTISSYWSSYWSGSRRDNTRDNTDARSVSSHSTHSSANSRQSNVDFASGFSCPSGLGSRHSSSRRPRRVMMMSNY